MKTAQLILQYLLSSKKVTLQDIGTLYLSPDATLINTEKEPLIPEGSLSFLYDPRAGKDEDFIVYIMQQTKKIRPLATSDLESYLQLGRQFLNLGKPFLIEGVGYLQKNPSGEIVFTPTYAAPVKTENLVQENKEKTNPEISFASLPKKKNHWKTWVPLALILIFLTGSVLYYFLGGKKEKEIIVQEQKAPKQQPIIPANTKPEIKIRTEADSPIPETELVETTSFRVVLKQYYDSAKAMRFYNLIRNSHPDLKMYTNDSLRYFVAVQFQLPLADTQRVRDSLARLIGLRTWIDLSSR